MVDDSKTMNGEYSDDQTVNIVGDEASDYELKISELSDEVTALEKEKQQIVHENSNLNDRIEKMEESMKHLSDENESLKVQVAKLGSENKILQAVAARASELEGEVSRLQHDLISAMSDLEEANGVNSKLKLKVESLEKGEMEKSIKMDAIASERDLLIVKVEGLVAKVGEKEEEVRSLESRIEELKLAVREKEELERKVRLLKGKLLEDKERVINAVEVQGRESDGLLYGKAPVVVEEDMGDVVEGKEKNSVSCFKVELPVVAVSAVGAIAIMGVMCYLHSKKK
ncbi:hypothetical protein ACH5RR_028376 [Cinchona calisaya]|uniref:Uncharacterized protein n=1 Tax=Cinchona calisaya TaxID=153742 RepID=A0ABD2YSI9_9GENT